jgi:two-component system, cell cycle response regulator
MLRLAYDSPWYKRSNKRRRSAMGSSANRQIIVVDDDAATLKLLQRQLAGAGYDVGAFGDGRSALGAISALNTGIVIADWSMPEMDGIALCRAIRELADMQALGNIYFILLTAHNSKERVVEGLEAGANDYLTKPYHPGELLARVAVGERMLRLQDELLRRTIEVQKVNAEMALLANRLDLLANTDPLTQLVNRRCLFNRLGEAWQSAARDGAPFSCVMLDVDRFKSINDTFGHANGDRVLKEVAETIRHTAPRPELCGRFGGEEFLVLLPATALAPAVRVAERIRLAIASAAMPLGSHVLTTTISCGVAEAQPRSASAETMVRQADAMLYRAKEHGRNQTWACDATGAGQRAGSEAPSAAPPPREGPDAAVQSAHAPAAH